MIDPSTVALYVPHGLKKFKLNLFTRIGDHVRALGGQVVQARHPGDAEALAGLPRAVVPVVGCTPCLRPLIESWRATGRTFVYWDRGYARRVFATWLPRGADGGYYRWHVNESQMSQTYRVPPDRWNALLPGVPNDPRELRVRPWRRGGRHVVVADTGHDYWDLFADRDWISRTVEYLRTVTDREIVVRGKEDKTPLDEQLADAHCLVTHGSIAAVEAVIMGCPVFVHHSSAAALMGRTAFSEIERPVYPERDEWLHSLAYCQFNEKELVDGTLWNLIR